MKDEDDMSSDSAAFAATQQSIKAYADAVATAATAALTAALAAYTALSEYTNEDSDGNAVLASHAYKAATDGFVSAWVANMSSGGDEMKGYVGTTNDPAGAGDLIARQAMGNIVHDVGVFFAVAKDEYFEIIVSSRTPTIFWKSKGALSEPIDQEP